MLGAYVIHSNTISMYVVLEFSVLNLKFGGWGNCSVSIPGTPCFLGCMVPNQMWKIQDWYDDDYNVPINEEWWWRRPNADIVLLVDQVGLTWSHGGGACVPTKRGEGSWWSFFCVSHPRMKMKRKPVCAVWYWRQSCLGAFSLSQVYWVVFICHFLTYM